MSPIDILIIVGAIATLVVAFFVITRKPKTHAVSPNNPVSLALKTDKRKVSVSAENHGGPPITILFGSQSGTAETFAYELAKEAKTHNFNPKVIDLEEYDHESCLAEEKFVCFLLATFGEGEPTDSAQKFYEWIMSDERDPSSVQGVEFAVFGLGNRQYEHFCAVGRRITQRMRDLGGVELLEHGEGDDDGSLEDDYAAWKEIFWEAVKNRFGGTDSEVGPRKFEGSYEIKFNEPDADSKDDDDDFVVVDSPEKSSPIVIDPKHNGGFVPVLENRELRPDSSAGSTRHIELDLSTAPFHFRTADNLGVYPRNDYKLAAKVAKRLGLHTKATFTLIPKGDTQRLPFPHNCSVHDALLWYCDLTSTPKRSLLETLATFATDTADRAKLLGWCTNDKAAFLDDQKNVLEVLEEVPSVKPPFEAFLEFIPKLVPRFYTISSSHRVDPTRCSITVSVTRADKPRGRMHHGVCSTFLAALVPSKDKVPVFVRASSFRPPWDGAQPHLTPTLAPLPSGVRQRSESKLCDTDIPMIMIGPGTGIAPFRGFLQEIKYLRSNGRKIGNAYLYFGCQRPNRDYIYKDELQEYVSAGVTEIITAFSREQSQKVYVQHRLEQNGAQVWELLDSQKGCLFLCGGTAMGRDVRNVLLDIFKQYGSLGESQAKDYLNNLQSSGRFIQELWS